MYLKAFVFLVVVFCGSVSAQCGLFLDNSTALIFAPISFTIRSDSPNPSQTSSLDFQGLQLFFNTTNAMLQIIEISNNNLVWAWGPNLSSGCTGGCSAVLQNDGNLVIYVAGSPQYGSGTWGGQGAYVLFTTSPPYLSVVDANCNQLWPGASYGSANYGPLPRTTPVLGTTLSTSVTLQAISADSWKSHFGVNTHMIQGWNSQKVVQMTEYIGNGHIRDGVPSTGSGQLPDFATLLSNGVHLTAVVGGAPNKTALANELQTFSIFNSNLVPGMLLHIEGFNEINNWPFDYNGIDCTQTYEGMAEARSDLWTLVKNDRNLQGVTVLDLTGGGFSDGPQWGLTNYTCCADYGTIHNYGFKGQPSVSMAGTESLFLGGIGGTYPDLVWQLPASNFVITEIGFHTDSYSDGVTEIAQGKLVVNTLLNGLAVGMRHTFIYELWDERWTGYEGSESHFGIFRNDYTPKPAATALHFLSQLLNDSNSVSNLGQLSLTFVGLPVDSQFLLFQNSLQTFILIIWNNAPPYNPITQTDILRTPSQATMTVNGITSSSISVYDIYSNADDTEPLPPISTVSNSQTAQFSAGDNAVVITITPQPTTQSSPLSTPSTTQSSPLSSPSTTQSSPLTSSSPAATCSCLGPCQAISGAVYACAIDQNYNVQQCSLSTCPSTAVVNAYAQEDSSSYNAPSTTSNGLTTPTLIGIGVAVGVVVIVFIVVVVGIFYCKGQRPAEDRA